mmetsp:Transcript_23954/g.40699  ORF Transcript_23954/g.40699 Transcript_23954/m.40699 type:complete len:147 (-) Transcript_23954:9-449(-)
MLPQKPGGDSTQKRVDRASIGLQTLHRDLEGYCEHFGTRLKLRVRIVLQNDEPKSERLIRQQAVRDRNRCGILPSSVNKNPEQTNNGRTPLLLTSLGSFGLPPKFRTNSDDIKSDDQLVHQRQNNPLAALSSISQKIETVHDKPTF